MKNASIRVRLNETASDEIKKLISDAKKTKSTAFSPSMIASLAVSGGIGSVRKMLIPNPPVGSRSTKQN